MAGGPSSPIRLHDVVILIGSVLLVSSVLLLLWTPSHTISVSTSQQELGQFHFSSHDKMEISLTGDSEGGVTLRLIPADSYRSGVDDGAVITSTNISSSEKKVVIEPEEKGLNVLLISGEENVVEYKVSIKRHLPTDWALPILGSALLAWGSWRRTLEKKDTDEEPSED